jgi:hypothetical protein
MPDGKSSFHKLLQTQWPGPPSEKVRRYLDKFYACERIGDRISGKVEGNHGTYTVSIWVDGEQVSSTCGCYMASTVTAIIARRWHIRFSNHRQPFMR